MRAEDLIRQLKKQDEQALIYLYDNYSGSLMGIILRILGNREVSEEILQKTMLKIWNNIDSFNPDKSSLFTWMAAIARNSAIDKRRLKSFQHQERTESIDALVHHPKGGQASTAGIDVEKLTASLEPKYKAVLDCIYLEGHTQREAAEKLGIPLGTVKTRLRLAIKSLGEELKNEKGLFLGLIVMVLLLILLLL